MKSRRDFVRGLVAASSALLGCGVSTESDFGSVRLTARPSAGTPPNLLGPGLRPLGIGSPPHDGQLLIPQSLVPGTPLPLVLALHGAGIAASGPISFLAPYAEAYGFLLLAPESYGFTWDAIVGAAGPDVAFIDLALRYAFDHCLVDPARIVVEGFSDGASYALRLGLANGDLFPRVVAFSPGFIPPSNTPSLGHPEFFVSHGRQDPVLPIGNASRVIVPFLELNGYSVNYLEYDGGHSVPAPIADAAVQWLMR